MTIWWWMNHVELLHKWSIHLWLMDVFPPPSLSHSRRVYKWAWLHLHGKFIIDEIENAASVSLHTQ
jgi:hypothetical protein